MDSGVVNSEYYNTTFIGGRDDAIDVSPNAENVKIYNNTIRHCFEGISEFNRGGSNPGEVYYNNVIDVTAFYRFCRPGASPNPNDGRWYQGNPWGSHDHPAAGKMAGLQRHHRGWRHPGRQQRPTLPRGQTGDTISFINNVVLETSTKRMDLYTTPATNYVKDHAGNTYWSMVGGTQFFDSLGLEIDPGFDMDAITSEASYTLPAINDPGRPAALAAIRALYKPHNLPVSLPGQSFACALLDLALCRHRPRNVPRCHSRRQRPCRLVESRQQWRRRHALPTMPSPPA